MGDLSSLCSNLALQKVADDRRLLGKLYVGLMDASYPTYQKDLYEKKADRCDVDDWLGC